MRAQRAGESPNAAGAQAFPSGSWTANRVRVRLAGLSPAWAFFALSLLLYFGVRLVGLVDFPIYFFGDEAMQTLLAADFLRDGLRNEQGILLPTFFKNGRKFNLGLSVYAQVLPVLLFGKSVFVTRAVSVLLSGIAALSVSLTIRDIFKLPYWWSAALLLSMAPAWFLHSRTAFETVIATAFYAAFVYFYLLYRKKSAGYLYPALVCGALTFYAYSPAQGLIVLTGALLLLSDLGYHWQNRRTAWRGLILLFLLALPYLRFRLGQPEAIQDHLRDLGSYWLANMPLEQKLARFGREYLAGLSVGYWYLPHEHDLPRHVMRGYGHLWWFTLPFGLLGLLIALRNSRDAAFRTVLIALAAGPFAGALVETGITRVLSLVVPLTLLTAIGLITCLTWLQGRGARPVLLAAAVFVLLAGVNIWMLRDALQNGPLWFRDYGLGGMQYGARQVFARIETVLDESPETEVILTPNWANGATQLARFFLGDPLPLQMASIDAWMHQLKPLSADSLFIMTPQEYKQMRASGKFSQSQVQARLEFPDGRPGFYFVRLAYAPDIQARLAEERAARQALREDFVRIDGRLVLVRYPLLDMGAAPNLVDGDERSLARTLEANPAVLEFVFPEERQFRGISIIIGSTEARITVRFSGGLHGQPVEYSQVLKGLFEAPEVEMRFDEPVSASEVHIEVEDIHQGEPAHIHIWEVRFHE